MKTREQEYAATIYDQVESVKNQDFAGEYKTHAKNLAFLIRSAGLVQALYFTNSRMEKLIEHLAVVVEKKPEDQTIEQHTKSFLKTAREENLNRYMLLTEKCLLALKWYKRCVDIHIKDDQTTNVEEANDENDEA